MSLGLYSSVWACNDHRPPHLLTQPLLGDKEYLLNVYLVSEVRRPCKVKQTESSSSLEISRKFGDGQPTDDTTGFLDQVHIFWRWRYMNHLHLGEVR